MSTNLQLNAGTLASPTCWPATPQLLYNEMFARGSALLGDITGIIISSTVPDAEDRDKGWIKTNAGNPTWPPVVYVFSNGYWIAPHPIPAESSIRQLWVGSSADLETYDGGEAGTPTTTSGPMWQIDTEFDGRMPIGPGTIPGTSPSRTVAVASNTDSSGGTGDWVHTIARAELPNERLHIAANVQVGEPLTDLSATGVLARYADVDSEKQSYRLSNASGHTDPTVGVTEALGQGNSWVQAPRFRGIYFIKRTIRQFYRAT